MNGEGNSCLSQDQKALFIGHFQPNMFPKSGVRCKRTNRNERHRIGFPKPCHQMDSSTGISPNAALTHEAVADVEWAPDPTACAAPFSSASPPQASSNSASPGFGCMIPRNKEQNMNPMAAGTLFGSANMQLTGSNPGKSGSPSCSLAAVRTQDQGPGTRLKGFSFRNLKQAWSSSSRRGSQATTQALHSKAEQRAKGRAGALFTLGWGRKKIIGCETLGDTDQKQNHPTPAGEAVKKLDAGDSGTFANVAGWHGAAPGGEEQVSSTATEKGGVFSQQSANEMDCGTSGYAGLSHETHSPGIKTSRNITSWNWKSEKAGPFGNLTFSQLAAGGEDGILGKRGENLFAFSNRNQIGSITAPFSYRDSGCSMMDDEYQTPIKATNSAATADANMNQMDIIAESLETMEQEPASIERSSSYTRTLRKLSVKDDDLDTAAASDRETPMKETKKLRFSIDLLDALEQTNTDSCAAIRKTLRDYNDNDLRKVTEFYRQRIEEAIEEFVEAISLVILNELKSDGHQYREIQQLVRDGHHREASKRLLDTVMESGVQAGRAMWETFVKMKCTKPKLRKILQDIENKGADLPLEVSKSLMETKVSNYLKEIQVQHKKFLHEKNKKLSVNVINGEKVISSLEDQYTEQVIIVSDPEQSVSRLDIRVRGKRREEGQRKMIKEQWETVRIGQLFRSSFGKSSRSGTAVVSGPAGIGKTTMVQKIVCDWAKGKIYQQFQFVFLFRFRDLNIKGRTSFKKLILDSYPHFKNRIEHLWEEPQGLLFILDGLDEFKEKIDFTDRKRNTLTEHECFHPECECELSDIVRCLIQQKVLKGCSVLITTCSTELESLRKAEINLWAEIMGFLKEQRKEYFKKYFTDQRLAERVFTYLEQNDILYSMCDNPSYCTIVHYSLAPGLRQRQETQSTLPTTVTQLFASYIANIFKNHEFNIYKQHDLRPEQIRDLVLRTGEIAYFGICNNITRFNEKQLNDFKLERQETLPGFMIQHRDTETSQTIFSFIHITLQEFVAALAKYLTEDPQNLALLSAESRNNVQLKTFLRFLVGLSSSGSAQILGGILGSFLHQATARSVIHWVKKQTESNLSNTQNNLNTQNKLSRCKLLESLYYLFESQNAELVQSTVGLGGKVTLGHDCCYNTIRLMPVDCAMLATVIDHCNEMQELNLNNCRLGSEGIQRLAPVLHKCKILRLRGNYLTDEGMKLLSATLRRPDCKIQTLDLCSNDISHMDAQPLAMGLTSNSSLTQLFLSKNKLGDTGVKSLCEALSNCHCKIQTLELCENLIRNNAVDQLIFTVSNNRFLTCLNLNKNKLGDQGLKLLTVTLSQQSCPIQTLQLEDNGMTDASAEELTRIPIRNLSMTRLNLSKNLFTDQSINALQNLIKRHTNLQEISLQMNKFSPNGANYLQSLSNHRAGLCVKVYTSIISKGSGTSA
ncbi:NACHT, LRR and PYD domains-containing protein 3-like [Carcharodon carcharias]|uniref:NACHT, LRR and PYD domains-containing protein 3-like n=1 Tax=Carcharodon carcharias TaxID=13397 RepID=UPI001B7E82F4|nr:NACHT, LRR and PYD domains-containing protein 3-like [Carcharodon carcharias]XP_041029886.1 NACHT, LRR and PYD domains-containing protein 3-like [Carcharodon carcharias]